MTDEHEHDDLAREIHAMRAEPRPEFARQLDERAAGWLSERPRRRRPSLRMTLRAAAAAASAAALVMALVIASGGDDDNGERLDVAVVSEGTPGGGASPSPMQAPGALEAAPPQPDSAQRDDAQPQAGGGAFLLGRAEGEIVTVSYLFPNAAPATVELAGREAEVTVGPGAGSLEISTAGLPAGSHELTIATPDAPTYRQRVEIDG